MGRDMSPNPSYAIPAVKNLPPIRKTVAIAELINRINTLWLPGLICLQGKRILVAINLFSSLGSITEQ